MWSGARAEHQIDLAGRKKVLMRRMECACVLWGLEEDKEGSCIKKSLKRINIYFLFLFRYFMRHIEHISDIG
jgi:hypothetical protein